MGLLNLAYQSVWWPKWEMLSDWCDRWQCGAGEGGSSSGAPLGKMWLYDGMSRWRVPSRKRVLNSNRKTTFLGIIQVCGLTLGATTWASRASGKHQKHLCSSMCWSSVSWCWPYRQMLATSRQVQVKQEERIEVDLNKVSAKQAAKQLLFHGKSRLIHRWYAVNHDSIIFYYIYIIYWCSTDVSCDL